MTDEQKGRPAKAERRKAIEDEQRQLIVKNRDVIEISGGGWMNRRNEARYQRHCERMDALNAEWEALAGDAAPGAGEAVG
jgi:hypothetical protein